MKVISSSQYNRDAIEANLLSLKQSQVLLIVQTWNESCIFFQLMILFLGLDYLMLIINIRESFIKFHPLALMVCWNGLSFCSSLRYLISSFLLFLQYGFLIFLLSLWRHCLFQVMILGILRCWICSSCLNIFIYFVFFSFDYLLWWI